MQEVFVKIDTRITDRDKKLMETLRAFQEAQKTQLEIASTTQKKWWQFWK